MYKPTRADIAHEGVYLANNMQVVGAGKNNKTRIFRNLLCGHEQEAHTTDAKRFTFRCNYCKDQKWHQEAADANLTFLEKLGWFTARYIFNECGHEQNLQFSNVRDKKFRCKQCQEQKIHDEAAAVGLTFIEKFDAKKSNYRFNECSHEQLIHTGNVKKGSFQCNLCQETWATRPSNLYLHYIKYEDNHLLKFGRARNVEKRSVQYGLPVGAELKILQVWPTSTGIDADRIETLVAKQFKRYNKSKAKMILQDAGYTECFHTADQQAIMDFVEQQVIQSTSKLAQIGLH